MKIKQSFAVAVAAFLLVALTGCTSVAGLADKKDTVGSIKKLSKMLIKDSSNQEAADVFNELYNREMTNKMYIVQTSSSDVLSNFASSQGASSVEAALKSIADSIPDRASSSNKQTVIDDSSVKDTINRLSELKNTYRDLTEIQSAVKSVPETIGSVQTYYVEKYTDNFNGGWTKAADDLGDFYKKCGDAMMPNQSLYEIANIIPIYKKAETEYLTQSKISTIRNTIYNLYMKQGDGYLTLAKNEMSEITKTSAHAIDDANRSAMAYQEALSYKSFDNNALAAQKEAKYYYALASLTAAEKGGASGVGGAMNAEQVFGQVIDYKDSRDKQKDARAIAARQGKKGELYYCSKVEYKAGNKTIVITYDKKGNELTVNGEDFSSLSNLDQITYKGMGGEEFVLWDGDFDYRLKGKTQLWSTGLVGEVVTYTYKKDADGTIHAYNSYNREIYTFTTNDDGATYLYKSDVKVDYYFTKL